MIYGTFDPRILGIQLNFRRPEHLRKYFDGSIKAHLPEVRANWPNMSSADKLSVLYFTTAATHEIKHYHDMVGSTFGFTYYFNRLSRQAELCRMLTQFSHLRLPLKRWCMTRDCPAGLRDFFRRYQELETRENALFFSRDFPGETKQIGGLIINARVPNALLPDTAFDIPVANFGYDTCRQHNIRHHYYPLTSTAILEGAAINVQHLQVHDFYGTDAAAFFEYTLRQEMFRGDLWIYTLTMLLIETALRRFSLTSNEHLRFRLYDFAFMGACRDGALAASDYPGIRLGAFLNYLLYEYPVKRLSIANIFELMERFAVERFGEETPENIIENHFDEANTIAAVLGIDDELTDLPEVVSTLPQIAMLKLTKVFREMLALRRSHPSRFSDPWEYLSPTSPLPMPPNVFIEENGGVLLQDIFNDPGVLTPGQILQLPDHEFWAIYFCANDILDGILFDGRRSCPFSYVDLRCPRYSERCGSLDYRAVGRECTCSVDTAARLLGLEEIEIEYLPD